MHLPELQDLPVPHAPQSSVPPHPSDTAPHSRVPHATVFVAAVHDPGGAPQQYRPDPASTQVEKM